MSGTAVTTNERNTVREAAVAAAEMAGAFLGKYAVIILDFLHKALDRVLATVLYFTVRKIGEGVFALETWLHEYLKKSKYVDDDQFDQKIEEERIICLGMGVREAERITLREISFELGVSSYYARQIKEVAKNWKEHLSRFIDIMREYRTDSEKKDKRSEIE